MTAEQFAKLAEFMGWRNEPNVLIDEERVAWWVDSKGALRRPGTSTSLTGGEAAELLEMLATQGYYPVLEYDRSLWQCSVWVRPSGNSKSLENAPTITEAVAAAVLALIEKQEKSN